MLAEKATEAVKTLGHTSAARLMTKEQVLVAAAMYRTGPSHRLTLTGMMKSSRSNVQMPIVGSSMTSRVHTSAGMQIMMLCSAQEPTRNSEQQSD